LTITHGYAQVTDLDEHLGDTKQRDSGPKERAIEAASRMIDTFCKRRFWLDDAPSSRRVRGGSLERLYLPDFTDLTGIAPETAFNTPGTAYDSTQYVVGPAEAPVMGEPYQWVEGACSWWWSGNLWFTGTWGWPSVPSAVAQACVMKAARIYKRRESVTGVVGLDEFGPIRVGRDDADVVDLLSPYKFVYVG
jgi:hypothetical protein